MYKKSLFALCFACCCSIANAQTESTVVTEESVETPAAVTGSVARSAFTSSVQDKEPTDNLSSADTSTGTLYFFTELKDLQDQTVIHRWSLGGEQKAEVSFNVGGPRWRVWSTKIIQPDWTGTWTVDVVDGSGNVLHTATLEYSAASEAEAPATENTL